MAAPEGEAARIRDLASGFRAGDRRALARAISWVEDGDPGCRELMETLLVETRETCRVGITGPPGAGKSTLARRLIAGYRGDGETVALVAVDPSSHLSGGALLGDRVRVREWTTDGGVFVRSMASRGEAGGLAAATGEVLDVVEAFGFDWILVETVGVGQTDLEIAAATETVVVVLTPESGDNVQALKAGLMELGDIFVVNKADRPDANRMVGDLRRALDLKEDEGREIPVVATSALSGEGVEELRRAVVKHRQWLRKSGAMEARRRRRLETTIRRMAEREIARRVWSDPKILDELARGIDRVVREEGSAYSAVERIVEEVVGRPLAAYDDADRRARDGEAGRPDGDRERDEEGHGRG